MFYLYTPVAPYWFPKTLKEFLCLCEFISYVNIRNFFLKGKLKIPWNLQVILVWTFFTFNHSYIFIFCHMHAFVLFVFSFSVFEEIYLETPVCLLFLIFPGIIVFFYILLMCKVKSQSVSNLQLLRSCLYFRRCHMKMKFVHKLKEFRTELELN